MRARQPGRREMRQRIGDACHEKQQSDGFDADAEALVEEIGEQRRREETAADGVDGEQRADPRQDAARGGCDRHALPARDFDAV